MSSDASGILPAWQAELWSHFAHAIERDRVAHGLLVCGPPGVGKRLFADHMMAALLCRERSDAGEACGVCAACRQVAAATHPDISRLVPEEPGRQIKVEQVRAFTRRLYLTPQYDSGRVGWIEPAEQLSPSAANSLLKTLEEPPPNCHILLITNHVSALMPTIRSRCQLWRVPPPSADMARMWFEAQEVDTAGLDADSLRTPFAVQDRRERDYDGLSRSWDDALSAVIRNRQDVSSVAEGMARQPVDLWLDWLYRRAAALMAVALNDERDTTLPRTLLQIAHRLDPAALQPWLAQVAEAARLAGTNADWQLVIESVLLDLKASLKRRPATS
ncbi:DNA polymerase III subunit delta' [Salinisphaera sp. T31B1]|uniref:DNA polymerase III subunit delta' n=1 Tax=Salinisphaera sp. T31B1 TaxID=727963 RepID=UPI0033401F20